MKKNSIILCMCFWLAPFALAQAQEIIFPIFSDSDNKRPNVLDPSFDLGVEYRFADGHRAENIIRAALKKDLKETADFDIARYNIHASWQDLNEDQAPELLIFASGWPQFCDSVGNCLFMIVAVDNDDTYRVLLEDQIFADVKIICGESAWCRIDLAKQANPGVSENSDKVPGDSIESRSFSYDHIAQKYIASPGTVN